MIKIQWLASIWRQNDQNVELRRKTFKTKLNYKSDQNPMTCIDDVKTIASIWSIWRQNDQNVELRRKTFKTTLNYKLQWLASIWWQNDHNNAKLRKLSNYDELHRFDDKTIKNVELRRKTFKTKLNYKSDQNPMTCIDLTSKRSKCWVTSQNIQTILNYKSASKQRKATKVIKI